jgi:hypothetical protein
VVSSRWRCVGCRIATERNQPIQRCLPTGTTAFATGDEFNRLSNSSCPSDLGHDIAESLDSRAFNPASQNFTGRTQLVATVTHGSLAECGKLASKLALRLRQHEYLLPFQFRPRIVRGKKHRRLCQLNLSRMHRQSSLHQQLPWSCLHFR